MRRRFRLRLAFTHALVAALVIVVVSVIVGVTAERRFERYLSDVRARGDEAILKAVQRTYHDGVGWDAQAIYALSQAARTSDVGLAVYDANGRLLFTVQGMSDHGGGTTAEDVVTPASSTASVPDSPSGAIDAAALEIAEYPIVVHGEQVGRVGVYAWADRHTAAANAFEGALSRDLTVAAVIAAAAALLAGVLVSRLMTRPLEELTDAAGDVAAGNLEARVSPHGDDEVATLAVAFNAMADALARDEQWRRDMTADLSHELHAPLATIQARVEALEDGLMPATPENLRAIGAEVERLGRLLGALRTLNELESEDPGLAYDRVELGGVVADGVARAQAEAGDSPVTIASELASAVVYGDRDGIARVVTDLLDNALKFSPSGGAVAVTLRVEAGSAVLSVSDNGPGIDPVDLPFVFDRFYRSQSARGTQGVGLGLAIVKGLVEAQDGAVAAANRPEGGAVFTVRLPLAG